MRVLNKLCTPRRMRTKITFFFTTVFLVAVLLLIICMSVYIERINHNSIRPYIHQKLVTAQGNTSDLIVGLNRLINSTMLTTHFQSQLFDEPITALQRNRTYSEVLINILIQDMNVISAVVFEPSGEVHIERSMGHDYGLNSSIPFDNRWRDIIAAGKGEFVYFPDGGGAMWITNKEQPFVTFVRDLNKLTDYSSFGYAALNITKEKLGSIISKSVADENSHIYVCDANGDIITSSHDADLTNEQIADYFFYGKDFMTQSGLGGKRAWIKASAGFSDWTLICVSSIDTIENRLEYFVVFALIVGLFLIALVYCGQLYLTRRVGKPLENLVKHMSMVKTGDFTKIPPDDSSHQYDEIVDLHIIFNQMLVSINSLIRRIEDEAATKRMGEITLLQEQIKPHFLYNALDAVSSLSLIGDHKTAYELTQALGGFYRTSLSSGQELVTIATEIECIKNYTTVLNIRYAGKLHMKFDVPPEVENYKVLRLILQPLVENAVYHGIRHREGWGCITVSVRRTDDCILLIVEDDGVGMTQDRISLILKGESRTQSRGFGIYSLIEKLTLHYRIDNPIRIESEVGKGTKVYVIVPLDGTEGAGKPDGMSD